MEIKKLAVKIKDLTLDGELFLLDPATTKNMACLDDLMGGDYKAANGNFTTGIKELVILDGHEYSGIKEYRLEGSIMVYPNNQASFRFNGLSITVTTILSLLQPDGVTPPNRTEIEHFNFTAPEEIDNFFKLVLAETVVENETSPDFNVESDWVDVGFDVNPWSYPVYRVVSDKEGIPTNASIESTEKGDVLIIKARQMEPGKSAYQIAVDNGFKGTEQEWLKSLEKEVKVYPKFEELTEEQKVETLKLFLNKNKDRVFLINNPVINISGS